MSAVTTNMLIVSQALREGGHKKVGQFITFAFDFLLVHWKTMTILLSFFLFSINPLKGMF